MLELATERSVIPDASFCPPGEVCNIAATQKLRDVALYYVETRGDFAALPDHTGIEDLSAVTQVGFGMPNPSVCIARHTSATDHVNYLYTPDAVGPGDSGGPLLLGHVIGTVAAPTVVGVLSSQSGEGIADNPGDYTSLLWGGTAAKQAPLDWIREEIARRDPDNDGVVDIWDKCPGGDDTVDTDNDGIPDDCDDCPGDTDTDGDGICDHDDNCIGVDNPFQENANEDYEAARTYIRYGDACDKTPVAVAVPEEPNLAFGPSSIACANGGDLSTCGARRNSFGLGLWTVNSTPSQVSQTTGLRFCMCVNADGTPVLDKTVCRETYGCGLDKNLFSELEGTTSDRTRWLRMTVYKGPPQFNVDDMLAPGDEWDREDGELIDYAPSYSGPLQSTLGRATWDWPLDAESWRTRGLLWSTSAPPGSFPPGEDIPGIIWTHNDSNLAIGGSYCSDPNSLSCGFGNTYTFWNPSERTWACPMPFDPNQEIDPEPIYPSSAVFSAPSTDPDTLDRDLTPGSFTFAVSLGERNGARYFSAVRPQLVGSGQVNSSFAVPCSLELDGVAQLSPAPGAATIVSSSFTPALRQSLRSPGSLRWIQPSEPVEIQSATSQVVSLAVDRWTGRLWGTVVLNDSGLFDLRMIDSPPAAVLADAPAAIGPSAYSGVTGELAQVRGTEPTGPLDTLRVSRLGGDAAVRALTPAEARPWAVRAMAFSGRERLVWLVGTEEGQGKSGSNASSKSYLLGVEAGSGRIVVRRQLLPSLERFWLSISATGDVVLVAATKKAPWYLVGVLESRSSRGAASGRLVGLTKRHAGRVIGAPRISLDALLAPVKTALDEPLGDPFNPGGLRVDGTQLASVRGQIQGKCFVEQPEK